MIPEEHWTDVEWFDSDVWSPPIGRSVLILDIYGNREHAIYDGDDFISVTENETISGVGYWSYDE